MYIMTNKSVSK